MRLKANSWQIQYLQDSWKGKDQRFKELSKGSYLPLPLPKTYQLVNNPFQAQEALDPNVHSKSRELGNHLEMENHSRCLKLDPSGKHQRALRRHPDKSLASCQAGKIPTQEGSKMGASLRADWDVACYCLRIWLGKVQSLSYQKKSKQRDRTQTEGLDSSVWMPQVLLDICP